MTDKSPCAVCGRRVSFVERALTKKLVNRGTERYLCIDCLARAFDVTAAQLREKIAEFKEMGCTLFDEDQHADDGDSP